MLTTYPEIPQDEIDRQGKTFMSCDVSTCDAEAEVTGIGLRTLESGNRTVTEKYAPMPDGWVTTDPDDNAVNGAANFCSKHASRVVKPQADAPEPAADES